MSDDVWTRRPAAAPSGGMSAAERATPEARVSAVGSRQERDAEESVTLFAFGTLMDEDVLAIVCDRPVGAFATEPARVVGRARRAVTDDHYPVLVDAPDESVDGLLIHALDTSALERIAFFEGEEFALAPIRVTRTRAASGRAAIPGEDSATLEAMHFAHTDRKPVDESGWELAEWQAKTKPDTLARVRRYMSHFGVLSVAEADAHWRPDPPGDGRAVSSSSRLGNDAVQRWQVGHQNVERWPSTR